MKFTIKGLELQAKGLKFNGKCESGIIEDASMKIEAIEVECKLNEIKSIVKEVMDVFVKQNSATEHNFTPTIYRCACGSKLGAHLIGEHCELCETNVEEIKSL